MVRILLVIALGYGLFRVAPVVVAPVGEVIKNSGIGEGVVLGKATDYINNLLGNEGDDEINNAVGDLVSKTKEVVSEKVQEETDKIKEGTKDVANEQFCKTVLKTLEEECGKFYCSE